MRVRLAESGDQKSWDSYVSSHPDSTNCHLFGWKQIIAKTYAHPGFYLIAEENGGTVGVLPLIHMKSLLFGSHLVSMPFLNYGGPLGDSEQIVQKLVQEATFLARQKRAKTIQFRQLEQARTSSLDFSIRKDKVRMVLDLPESAETLFKSFKAKLRSQIRKPQKEGCHAVIGGLELLDDFYKVFSINMRDLGSPVHSRTLFRWILTVFAHEARICVVFHKSLPVAGGIVICHKKGMEIPWASSLRDSKGLASNMLLYWTLLEYACNNSLESFDFGRSTKGEGTFKFKEQWGARPEELNWTTIPATGSAPVPAGGHDRLRSFERIWKMAPVPIANLVGPLVRGLISL